MKKQRITYGIAGMMEFETVIMVGQQPKKILFTGGSINALGTHPAKYTTDSLMLQHSIERSKQYKSGLIKRIRTVELDQEVLIGTNSRGNSKEVVSSEPEMTGSETKEAADAPEEESGSVSADREANGLIQVEFEVNDDAKDYLEQNFGVARNKLKNREDIVEAGKANGVDIVFI